MDYPLTQPNVNLSGGKFTDGNPLTGATPSRDPSSWANDVTDSILNVQDDGALAPAEGDPTQMSKALRRRYGGNVTTLAATQALTDDMAGLVLINAGAANVVLTLPAAADGPYPICVMRIDNSAFTVTIAAAGTDAILPDGDQRFTLSRQYSSRTLRSDGIGSWYTTANINTAEGYAVFKAGNAQPFIIPAQVINIRLWGPGGGGGAGDTSAGSAGGGGALVVKKLLGLTPGNTLFFNIPSGGTAGAGIGTNGGNAANATVTAGTQAIGTVTANGGQGGGANTSAGANGGAPAAFPSAAADWSIGGGFSKNPKTFETVNYGGIGGSAPMGGAGGVPGTTGPIMANWPGGGGAGGTNGSGVTDTDGGAGADAGAIVEW